MSFVIHDEMFKTGYLEGIQENLTLFNAASNGCILMREKRIAGDFEKQSYLKGAIPILDRDPTSSAPRPIEKWGEDTWVGVKIPFKTPVVEITHEDVYRGGRTIEQFSFNTGKLYAESELSHRLECAIAALKAATVAAGAAMNITSATLDAMSLSDLIGTYGDKADLIRMFLMHSGAHTTLSKNAISANRFGEVGGVVYGAEPGTLGRPTLVRDDVALKDTTHWVIMALTAGAVEISDNSQLPKVMSWEDGNNENITYKWTAEGTFNVKIKGYSWSETTGGANPTRADLATTANWIKLATSTKSLAAAKLVV